MTRFRLGQKARGAGFRLVAFESIGSTNVEASAAAAAGDVGDVWFVALEQTAGRGRRGRQWQSPYGNLAASLLVKPTAPANTIATLGFVAGIAMRNALASLVPEWTNAPVGSGLRLKWPNDVLYNGAKIAGILLEAQNLADGTTAVTIGCGVNVLVSPAELPYPATNLAALGTKVDAQALHTAYAECWVDVYDMWDNGRGVARVLSAWRDVAAGIGAPISVTTQNGVVRGEFETIDDHGQLIVKTDVGARVPIAAGDVHFGAVATEKNETDDLGS